VAILHVPALHVYHFSELSIFLARRVYYTFSTSVMMVHLLNQKQMKKLMLGRQVMCIVMDQTLFCIHVCLIGNLGKSQACV